MGNKKVFFIGLITGLLVMGAAVWCFTYLRGLERWGGELNPNAKVDVIYEMLDFYSINEYDRQDIMEDMYRGMLSGVGDPYTYYYDEEAYADFTEKTEGVYVGVGIAVTQALPGNEITLVNVYEGSPAYKAGLKPGDVITGVNNEDVTGKQMEEVTAMIKGREGTAVNITVNRPDMGSISMDVQRENISIPTVSHKMVDGVIGYIRIDQFDRVTLGQFNEALADLTEQQMRGLIIDLRDNPGGLMDTVTDIADTLLPKGVITYTEDKRGEKEYYNSDAAQVNIPLALLVNGNSASASEVLTGAVKDTGRGVVVGTKTFGKGIVQNMFPLNDGSAIKITVAKYYTPSGVCIQGEGIEPDYVVEMGEENQYTGGLAETEDAQLQKAVEVMWARMAGTAPAAQE